MKAFIYTAIVLVLASCGSASQKDATSNPELNELINKREYTIESNFAMPLGTTAVNAVLNSGILGPGSTSNQISLIGNYNFLTIKGDSIKADLPYYGERRMGGGYNSSNTGITIDGLLRDYEVETKKGMYIIRFKAKDTQGNELYNIIVNMSPNMVTNLSVNSSQRTNIQYRGEVEAIKEEDADL